MAKVHRKGVHHAVKEHAKHEAKSKNAAKGKKPGHKGHKLTPKQKAAMHEGRAKWLASKEGKAWRAYMSELRKSGVIGRGGKGGKKGHQKGKFKLEKKKAKGKKPAHKKAAKAAKGARGGHHKRRHHGKRHSKR